MSTSIKTMTNGAVRAAAQWRVAMLTVLAIGVVAALAIVPSAASASTASSKSTEKVAVGREKIEPGGSIVIEAEDSVGREVLTTLRIRGGYFDYTTATGEIELLYRNAAGQTSTQAYPVDWVEKWGPNIEFGAELPFIGPNNHDRSAYFETEIPGLVWDMGYYGGGLLAPGAHEGINQLEAEVMMMQVR